MEAPSEVTAHFSVRTPTSGLVWLLGCGHCEPRSIAQHRAALRSRGQARQPRCHCLKKGARKSRFLQQCGQCGQCGLLSGSRPPSQRHPKWPQLERNQRAASCGPAEVPIDRSTLLQARQVAVRLDQGPPGPTRHASDEPCLVSPSASPRGLAMSCTERDAIASA